MEKVLQRAERASRVAARRVQRKQQFKKNGEGWERNQGRVRVLRAQNERIREARKQRKIDWEAGALAPRRDVGDLEERYGALQIFDMQLPEKDPEKRPRWMHIREGDRVVILRGRDKGKIGVVNGTDEERAAIQISDLNKIDIQIPEWLKDKTQRDRVVVTSHPQYMPLDDAKLVYPLSDPETGIPRDVIIDRLIRVDKDARAIPGTSTIIPWPEQADEDITDHEDDTLRISVEEQTFRPFLIRPPMPLSVIDELRHKYSKFRTRHDYEYQMKKELEDAKTEDRRNLIKTMRTPLQELAELRIRQKQQQKKELTPEQLARIGEVIAQERGPISDGVSVVAH